MAYKGASDQSKNRRWSVQGDSYMLSVRIREPLLTDFREYCESSGMIPADVVRKALRQLIGEDPSTIRKT